MDILASTHLSVLKAEMRNMELKIVIRFYGLDVKFIVIGKAALFEP
jgi:hypothetical protein